MTVIIFLIVLAVLIFVHELGHFLAARMFGIRVDAFKIGFGPRILYWKGKETEYGINAIPFGGFVKIFGENPDAESTTGEDAARSFVNKAKWKQVIVLAAGVIFNFLFAWLLYVGIFASGVTASTESFGNYRQYFANERVIVTNVMEDSPADKAGVKVGDTVLYVETTAMNGIRAQTDSPAKTKQTISEIQDIINDYGGKPVAVALEREGNITVGGITPVEGIVPDRYAIGISMDNVADLRLPFFTSIYEGMRYTIILTKETCIGLFAFFKNIFIGQPDFTDVAGPVGIAGIIGNAASLGFTYLVMITAIISLNLAVINLIPFPALDGGRVLFVVIESIIRRSIPAKFQNAVNALGFILLMVLMVVITWRDVAKLFN